ETHAPRREAALGRGGERRPERRPEVDLRDGDRVELRVGERQPQVADLDGAVGLGIVAALDAGRVDRAVRREADARARLGRAEVAVAGEAPLVVAEEGVAEDEAAGEGQALEAGALERQLADGPR